MLKAMRIAKLRKALAAAREREARGISGAELEAVRDSVFVPWAAVVEGLSELEKDSELGRLIDEADEFCTELKVRIDAHEQREHAARAEREAIERAPEDARLRPCTGCQGKQLLVRDQLRIEAWGGDLELKMVVCAGCGHVRFEVPSADALRALATDSSLRRVKLP